nr:MAG TPA: hypothetical protein [Caudoviricetes sp.]
MLKPQFPSSSLIFQESRAKAGKYPSFLPVFCL